MTDLCTANLSASVGDNKCMKVGIKDIAYLANYDEIDSFTYHATLPNVITNVVMKNDPSVSVAISLVLLIPFNSYIL